MSRKNHRRNQAGFSLLEIMVTMLVLVIVMGAVFSQVNQIQSRTKMESMKLDLTQESRAFVDQFARDLHMSGYPISTVYQTNPGTNSKRTAVGLVFASPISLRFEGDVYGDGHVYSVLYTYVASDAADPSCPCLRRSVVEKVDGDVWYSGAGGQSPPQYFTEVQNVITPQGQSQDLFTYFQGNGNAVSVGSCTWSSGVPTCPGIDINGSPATIQLIDAIKVNLNTRSKQFDPQTGQPAVNSVSTIAELEN
ncbi:MAG TPA: prepilin-type N-terminal cleavage/methylation domain-containing protein [Terriglobales bacterium]|jgi:prepilin-type N-terminal cleavage/methylation domain-containing protein|nr:prepilin-type N-terminal cleavage/methylation domain-containing protein [Terriglobales bacterium]